MDKKVYGFVGAGNMGGPMATRLLNAGETVHVVDRDANAVEKLTRQGAIAQPTPAALGDVCDVVFLSLPDGNVVTVVRTGYSLNGRLLRPAAVIVSSGAANKDGAKA